MTFAGRVRARLATERGRTALKYATVSVISVIVGQVALVALFYFANLSARPANIGSCIAGGIPNYYLNRRWSWGKSGRHALVREVTPFWVMTLLGLVLSTWLAGYAGSFGEDHFESRAAQTALVAAASLFAFGALWIAKFVMFGKMFSPKAGGTAG